MPLGGESPVRTHVVLRPVRYIVGHTPRQRTDRCEIDLPWDTEIVCFSESFRSDGSSGDSAA